jgi:Recombinase zinc beta ribbon domain/Recombinase
MNVSQLARFVFDTFFTVGTVSETARQLHDIFGIQAQAVAKSKNNQNNVLGEQEEIAIANINTTRGSGLNLRYPNTGLKWSISGLRSQLVNPIYAGGTAYNTVQYSGGHRKPFDEWEVAWETHDETIITHEEHERVKSTIRENRNNRWAGEQKYTNFFANLVKCTQCGAALSRQSKKLVKRTGLIRHHYQCSFYRTGACHNRRMISNDELEKQVIEWLVRKAERLAILVEQEVQVTEEPAEIRTLRASLNTLDALPSNPAIEKAKEDILSQIEKAIATASDTSKQYLIAKERIAVAFSNQRYWESLEPQDKQALLKGCIRKITVDGNKVTAVQLLHLY